MFDPSSKPVFIVLYFGWVGTVTFGVGDYRVFHYENACLLHLEEGIGAHCKIGGKGYIYTIAVLDI